jgi:hypothetical protein
MENKHALPFLAAVLALNVVAGANLFNTILRNRNHSTPQQSVQIQDTARVMSSTNNGPALEGIMNGDYDFHETGRLSNGVNWGRLGAMTYILNNQGRPTSSGFHEIIPTDSGYNARIGACNFQLDRRGRIKGRIEEGCGDAPHAYHAY